MRRDQLEHAIRAACQIVGADEIIVVGSQSILASYDESDLPPEATMSREVDVLPLASTPQETGELADHIEGIAGEWSSFEELHGFSIDGVDVNTAILPAGWRDRLVAVRNLNTAPLSGEPQFTGWCLQKGGPLRGKVVCIPGQGSQLRGRASRCRSCRCRRHFAQTYSGPAGIRRACVDRGALALRALAVITGSRRVSPW